jgi:DNA polymerase-3 subunit epsilon
VRLRLPSIGGGEPRCASAAAYARAELSGRRMPWREASWCVVDLELTGLDPDRHEIVSFGALPVESGRVQLHHAVTGLARPEGVLSESSIRVHGMRAADLADAPPLDAAIVPLLEAMTGRILVAHAARVERAFLGPALRRQGVKLRGPIVDTITLGQVWLHERDGSSPRWVSLTALAGLLGLPAERPHDALGDALTTAQIFIALATHLDDGHAQTVGSLVRAGRRLASMVAYASGPGSVSA